MVHGEGEGGFCCIQLSVQGSESRVKGSESRVKGPESRVKGSESRVKGRRDSDRARARFFMSVIQCGVFEFKPCRPRVES